MDILSFRVIVIRRFIRKQQLPKAAEMPKDAYFIYFLFILDLNFGVK